AIPKQPVVVAHAKKIAPVVTKTVTPAPRWTTVREKHELPFGDPVTLARVEFKGVDTLDLLALFRPAPDDVYESLVAENAPEESRAVEDEVSTQLAKSAGSDDEEFPEPEFFDYAEEKVIAEETAP